MPLPVELELNGGVFSLDATFSVHHMAQLQPWESAYEVMLPYVEEASRLRDVQSLSEKLAILLGMALKSVESGTSEYQISEIEEMLDYLENGENGLVVAVVPGLRLILE